jgi:hypothetical protein
MARMRKAIGVFAATLAATTLPTLDARAETGGQSASSVGGVGGLGGVESIRVDWSRLLVELDVLARGRDARDVRESAVASRMPVTMQQELRMSQLVLQNSGNAWFGVAPRVGLVARDWGSAFRLAGDRLSLVDAVRLSASTRMVMTRVRIANPERARVVPFIQLGAGQWRTDPNLLPLTPHDTEVAGQLGGGVEVRLASFWQLACESSATMLVRDGRGEGAIPQTKMWSTSMASRLTF